MIPLVQTSLPPKDVLMPSLEGVLYSGYIAQGKVVDEFELSFSNYVNNKNCISLNSGSAALHIALILAGVGLGDEVISTPLTAEPTNTVIAQTGAKIVWADIDVKTGSICPLDVERKITDKTKAIMVVHYAGIPVDLNAFHKIEKKYGIPIIEDAAHALGAKFKGKMLGSLSKYTIFSFQAIKHLTTIDGGMLTLDSQTEYEKAKLIRWFGLDKTKNRMDNDIVIQGYKYHMNNVNAQIGLLQMSRIEEIVDPYIENGKFFDSTLKGLNLNGVELLEYYPDSEPSYWLYTLKVKNRDLFISILNNNGVSASELHKRNDTHSIFSSSKVKLPQLDSFYKEMVHIPCGWWVGKKEKEIIVDAIKQYSKSV